VLTYELRMAAGAPCTVEIPTATRPPAQAEEMGHFYHHLEQVLLEIDFLDPANPRRLMRRLRRLFNRALPDQNEINILRGILGAVQGRKKPSRQ
jgi:tRNA C32,U32 (ribose-2'-O)-methylase TrmJ